jgi:hypothetical protein
MGLRLSNRQLKMLTEVVLQQSKDDPNVEWDDLLNRMIGMCRFRGMTLTFNSHSHGDFQRLGELAERAQLEHVPANQPRDNGSVSELPQHVQRRAVHPLFRDARSSGNGVA